MTADLFELEAPADDAGCGEAGPAHMQPPAPVSQLTKHWQAAMREYLIAPENGEVAELLALGAIRALYWLALGSGEATLATTIANWWADVSPMHGLGDTIK
ncbi:hypothetical protein [Aeromonas salmonicida]|uniref:hypothetical protein n=1 Tax=Aeromonas salmonicida TaxID=645 RepID=UPI003D19A162